jgi:YVTN family beta-propeller protein
MSTKWRDPSWWSSIGDLDEFIGRWAGWFAEAPIKVGHSPCSMAIAPDGRTVYVTNQMAGTVTPISTRTNRAGKPIKVGFMASVIVFTPDGRTAYVGTANTVVPFNTATRAVGKAIPLALPGFMGAITDMAITPDGKTVYVATLLGTVVPISTRTGRAGKPIRLSQNGVVLAGSGMLPRVPCRRRSAPSDHWRCRCLPAVVVPGRPACRASPPLGAGW